MKRSIFIIFLLASVAFVRAQIVSEILGRPSDKSITLNVIFDSDCQAYFQYGSQPGNYTITTSTFDCYADVSQVTVFDKLNADSQYFYRTCYKTKGSNNFINGTEHSFHTQRAKGSTYCFTIEADPHLYDKKGNPAMMKVTLQNELNDKPDFVFDLGDTFGDDHDSATITQQEADQLHYNFLPYIGMVCHSAPFFFCVGNHEGESGYFLLRTPPDNLAVYSTLARKKYYSNPVPDGFYTGNTANEDNGIGLPENYYAWEWGDALFVVLDAYRGYTASVKPGSWDWTLGEPQYKWFENTLKNSTARYKFVFSHHTLGQSRGGINTARLFEWGGYDQKNNYGFTAKRPGWDLPIHQLMIKNGVNVFFQGHDHLFAQEELDGLVYQECPMPSDSTYNIGMLANADAYTVNQLNGSGHIRVTVGPDSSRVEYIRAYLPKDVDATHKNGEVAFTYYIKSSISSVNETASGHKKLFANVYPNPADDILNILLPKDAQNLQILLSNAFGQTVLQTNLKSINVEPFPDGIYFLNIKTDKGEVNRKIIIRH